LEALDSGAIFALRMGVEQLKSAEGRTRIKRLLARIDKSELENAFDTAQVRLAVGLLGKLGTADARRVLRDLSKMEPDTLVAKEARLQLEKSEKGK